MVMQFIIKFFPEITIKSKPVRKRLVKRLHQNVRKLLKKVDSDAEITRQWDQLTIITSHDDKHTQQQYVETLSHIPGICHFLEVMAYPLQDLHDIYTKTQELWGNRLTNKTFAVRCKRAGQHHFSSMDVERYVGSGLDQNTAAAGVDLQHPDITIHLEIRDDKLYMIHRRHQGLGGFPLGELDPVLSLLSGGFDSTVASYLCMKRGMCTHFCFFNIGGRDHERGVKEVAFYLWNKYGASSPVTLVVVPFEAVVASILSTVSHSQMGVILKRMMLRAATQIAASLGIHALVTGESVAQVSSQTLANLKVIDQVTDTLVLRPLITTDKEDIIRVARKIGTEAFAATMPEYCGVISVKPTIRAKPEKIMAEEDRFDFAVLEQAIASARMMRIDQLPENAAEQQPIDMISVPAPDHIIIDIRHPHEHSKPLKVWHVSVKSIPFYKLHSQFSALDTTKTYLLYCDKNIMSRLHAARLLDEGYTNVKVYRPLYPTGTQVK